MTHLPLYLIIAALALGYASLSFAADAPQQQQPPATTQPSMGEVRIQSLKGYTYCYISAETTLNTLQDAIGQLIPKFEAAMDSGQVRPTGPVIFTYHGPAGGDRNKRFTLDVGAMVKAGSAAPQGFAIVTVGPIQCATLLYTGTFKTLPAAFGKLYGEIYQKGLQPSEISREWYLYFEDPESPNNIVQIQAELAPAL